MTAKSVQSSQRRERASAILIMLVVVTANGVSARSQEDSLTANDREALITAVAEKIDAIYPFADAGRETRDGILANLRSGAYDRLTSRREFAARLTSDMENLSHFSVVPGGHFQREPVGGDFGEDGVRGFGPFRVAAG